MQSILEQLGIETVVGFFVAIFTGLFVWGYRTWIEKNETNRIVEYMKADSRNFLSTHFIASKVNLPEEKVRKLCGKSEKIRRNEKEKESWTLAS